MNSILLGGGQFKLLNPDRLHHLAMAAKAHDQVMVGLLNVDFTYIPPEAFDENNPKIRIDSTGQEVKYREIAGKNPYVDLQAVVIGPYNNKVTADASGKVNFNFLYGLMQLTGNPVKNLYVDFGDGVLHMLFEERELKTFNLEHTFSGSGEKILHFTGKLDDDSPIDTYARLQVDIPAQQRASANITTYRLRANEYFHNYSGDPDIVDDPDFREINKKPEIEYGILYAAGSNGQLHRPIIITDGYDPGDSYSINDFAVDYRFFFNYLQNQGYDVVIANFPQYLIGQVKERLIIKHHGSGPGVDDVLEFYVDRYRDGGDDYIERNAKALEALIRHINTELAANGGQDEQLVVIGPSMGGLITRYALAEMEQNGEDHNTRLWVAFDAPLQGANIPAAYQFAVWYLNTYSYQFIHYGGTRVSNALSDAGVFGAIGQLARPAPKQMLVDHLRSVSADVMHGGAPGFRNRFVQNLNAVGYPLQCRKIALINGSFNGTTYGAPGVPILQADVHMRFGLTGLVQANFNVHLKRSGNSGTNEAMYVHIPRLIEVLTDMRDAHKYIYTDAARGSTDVAPGSYYPFTDANGNSYTPEDFTPFSYTISSPFLSVNVEINNPFFAFIPTKSALDFQGPERLNEDLCSTYGNLVTTQHTPFDSYYAPLENQEHVVITNASLQWLNQEINGNPQPPYPQNCNAQLVLTGPDRLCPGDQGTYHTNIPVTWSVGQLNIISQTPMELVVEKTNMFNASQVTATSSDGQVQSKTIYCHPVIDTHVHDHTVDLITGDAKLPLDDQNITDVVWEQTHGNASFTFAGDREARFTGGDYYGTVTVTNDRGSTTKVFFGPEPDKCYIIKKVGPDKFQVIDRCGGYRVIATMPLKEIYDEFGSKLGDAPVVNDKLDVSQSGNSGDIRIIKVQVNGETVSKRYIKD